MLHDGRYEGAATERQVLAVERLAIRACFERNATRVIIDDTNLAPSVLNDWRDLAIRLGARFEVHSFLDVPIETCIARDAARREHERVGEDKIREMREEWHAAITALLGSWRTIFEDHAVVMTP
jgi:predicted kinase